MTSARPTPERLALALARNKWNDVRRYPREAATDLALLCFLCLMLLGVQFQVVSKLVEELEIGAQRVVNLLPIVCGIGALFIGTANPARVRRAAVGNWIESLPIDTQAQAHWALRQACYVALLSSAAGSLLLADVAWLRDKDVQVSAQTIALTWCVPVAVTLLRAALLWRELLTPREPREREFARRRDNALRRFVLSKHEDALTKGLASFALGHVNPATLWLKLIAVVVTTAALIARAIAEAQAPLLVLGAVLVPLLLQSSLKPQIERVYELSRSLPLSFRRLTWANVKAAVLPPLVFALPFVLATTCLPEGGQWFLILLLIVPATGALLVLQLVVEQAFPQSQTLRVLFLLAASVGLGVFALQAPLIAPFIGLLLCIAWLLERGWGVWEFGYGERAR